jgi:hypothetical protein
MTSPDSASGTPRRRAAAPAPTRRAGVRNVHVAAQAGRRNLSDRRLAVAGRAKDEDGLARVDRAPRTSGGTDARPVRSPQPLLVESGYTRDVLVGER